jgi:hypothetical protein
MWIYFMGNKVMQLAGLPDDAWRTHLGEDVDEEDIEQNKRGKRRGKKGM